jgi:hypothetical protein
MTRGLEGICPAHTHAEEAGGELLVGAPQLRALKGDRPGRGLDRRRAVAVARSVAISIPAGIALAAQELGDLGFESGLHQKAHPEASDVFEDVAEILVRSEQLVDVSADALDGRYSGGHGCGFSFLSLEALGRNLRPSSIYTADGTPPGPLDDGLAAFLARR